MQVLVQTDAPVLRANEVELTSRPHTLPAESATLLEITKEQLLAMAEGELVQFALEQLGLLLDPNWSRGKMLSRLMSMAKEAVEY